jgi:hypothetical protein
MWLLFLGVGLTLAIELAALLLWVLHEDARRSRHEAEHFVDLVCRQDSPVSQAQQRAGLN